MSELRFKVGSVVLCNLGENGWKLGRVVALHYRETHWPKEQTAPYQVILDADHSLIYVPQDDDRLCREATAEDLKIIGRIDALAELPGAREESEDKTQDQSRPELRRAYRPGNQATAADNARPGVCRKAGPALSCAVKHYRCVSEMGLGHRHGIDLGTLRVGDSINQTANATLPSKTGFLQCPTLVRLPPGCARRW